MKYQCIFTKNAEKEFSKIDSYQQKKIDTWIIHNLKNCIVPRQYGKSLSGQLQRYWSYRVGNYRIICEIDDENSDLLQSSSKYHQFVLLRFLTNV